MRGKRKKITARDRSLEWRSWLGGEERRGWYRKQSVLKKIGTVYRGTITERRNRWRETAPRRGARRALELSRVESFSNKIRPTYAQA